MTKPIQITHEAPISLMPLVRELTDYDYCLVHLCDQDPNYVKFFQDSKKMGRKIIMDCSVYELGHSYDWDRYAYWIRTIQPDEYIVPDVFMKYEENITEHNNWGVMWGNELKWDYPSIKHIGVVQGNTLEEFEKSYKWMANIADKIAISFGYGYFWDQIKDTKKEVYPYTVKTVYKPKAYHDGRRKLLKHFIAQGIINYNKPHHLLGCGLPDEFRLYADEDQYSFIESIDTTHPVMTAIDFCGQYIDKVGLDRKSDKKMIDIYNQSFDEETIGRVQNNINYFREEICGYSKLN